VKTYRHFRANTTPEQTKTDLPFEDESEHEQIVPETEETYPYVRDVRSYVTSWLGADLNQGMQWEQSPLWHHPVSSAMPLIMESQHPPWLQPLALKINPNYDMPLDLSLHK